MKLSEISNI